MSQSSKKRYNVENKVIPDRDIRLSELITLLVAAHQKYGDREVRCLMGGKKGEGDEEMNIPPSAVFSPCLVVTNVRDTNEYAADDPASPYIYLQNDVCGIDLHEDDCDTTEILGHGMLNDLLTQGKIKDWRLK